MFEVHGMVTSLIKDILEVKGTDDIGLEFRKIIDEDIKIDPSSQELEQNEQQ